MSLTGNLAGSTGSSKSIWFSGSQLEQTRLDRFILVSFIIHLIIILSQLLTPGATKIKADPPPVKVKYLPPEIPDGIQEKGTIVDAPKPKKIEKPKSRELLASHDSRAHSNRIKSTPQKTYQRRKTVVPQAAGAPAVTRKSPAHIRKKTTKPVMAERKSEHKPLPLGPKGTLKPIEESKPVETPATESQGSRGAMSLLDGFDAEKYASLDTGSLEDIDDGEVVSLDTTETKYASYFNRIKHQIQRVWTYPVEAAQRGISGQMTLRFAISKDGNLLGVRIVDQSGHEILDLAAVKAVKEAAPFYPFPVTIEKDKLAILATFVYSPAYGPMTR